MYCSRLRAAAAAFFVAVALSLLHPVQAEETAVPRLVEQIDGGNWLDPKEAETLRDELSHQRAIHAYMTMLPALDVIGMRDGSEAAFGVGDNVLPIWKDRMDSRAWAAATADWMQESYLDVNQRAAFFQYA